MAADDTAAVTSSPPNDESYNAMGAEEEGEETPLMVHVVAPATLPERYTFEAEINGDPQKVITCVVPEGGVEEGQVFLTPLPKNYGTKHLQAPTGRWKDGLFDCFGPGVGHPSVWCSLCCTPIAMAQVMTRMELTWLGEIGPRDLTLLSFRIVFLLTVCYYTYATALDLASLPFSAESMPAFIPALKFFGNFLFTVYTVIALCRTRQHVRSRYSIPEQNCEGCEDLCCAFWCGCCTTAQMLRHTGEYETIPGVCCSRTGHPPGTPLLV